MPGIARRAKRYPSDMTDGGWERMAPLMPEPVCIGHPRDVEFCEVINVVRYPVRLCCSGHTLPIHFHR